MRAPAPRILLAGCLGGVALGTAVLALITAAAPLDVEGMRASAEQIGASPSVAAEAVAGAERERTRRALVTLAIAVAALAAALTVGARAPRPRGAAYAVAALTAPAGAMVGFLLVGLLVGDRAGVGPA